MLLNISPRSILGVLRRFFIVGSSSILMNECIRASLYQRSTPTCITGDQTSVGNSSHDTNTDRKDQRTRQAERSYQTGFGLMKDRKELVPRNSQNIGNEILSEARREKQIHLFDYVRKDHDIFLLNIYQVDLHTM
jgi:hypothetical protein